jgi:hypothetical protein
MKKPFLLIAIPFCIVLAMWVASYPIIRNCFPTLIERAQFGSTFGATSALFSGLAFAAVVSTLIWQHNRSRADQAIDRALRLYDEWHSPLMHESRIKVSNLIATLEEKKQHFPTLTELERQQRERGDFTDFADHVFRIIHFFERWAWLSDQGMADHTLLRSLLQTYLNWYQAKFMRQLNASHETNPDFLNMLERIQHLK